MRPARVPPELRTPRLLLRAPIPSEASASLAAQLASRTELRRWMVWAQAEPTLDSIRENLTAAAERFDAGEELRYHV